MADKEKVQAVSTVALGVLVGGGAGGWAGWQQLLQESEKH